MARQKGFVDQNENAELLNRTCFRQRQFVVYFDI